MISVCGRFALHAKKEEIIQQYELDGQVTYEKRYNIAPTQPVLAIINDEKNNRGGYLKWGLVPPWAKDASIGHKLINARGETVAEKRSFQKAFHQKRCLILANGFYEWKRDGNEKVPMYITFKDQRLFAFAGLWETFQASDSHTLHTCTIITTTPNEIVKEVHDRMPVILDREGENLWLDRATDQGVVQDLLRPFSSKNMVSYQVSSFVNSPKNEGAHLLKRDEPYTLF